MTDSEIQEFGFDRDAVASWAANSPRTSNWPVVYTINSESEIYVGETTNVEMRMRQHLTSEAKAHLKLVNVIIDNSFNKSVCLDLESHLIKYFHADDKYRVVNGNAGITDADYFDRAKYRESFNAIFDRLVQSGQLTRTVPELINSDFFKYSPFKALTTDQAIAVGQVLEMLFDEAQGESTSHPIVLQGDPGTGKTIVAVYLIKMLRDIAKSTPEEALELDSVFSDFFVDGYRQMASGLTIGLVIPQKSLRDTLRKVFSRTPGLEKSMVMDPFEVGQSDVVFDLLIVDEAHRLQQRNNQPAAQRNKLYKQINETLFGHDDTRFTQLDWILNRSRFQVFLIDKAQSVKPADLPEEEVDRLLGEARANGAFLTLTSQMRVEGGQDYIDYVGQVLKGTYSGQPKTFGHYEAKIFSKFSDMVSQLRQREAEFGLARLVAGFAWPWVTRNGAPHDFVIEGHPLIWNRRDTDWINSQTSSDEVGSIHTVQGYDLNYAAVIIGPDLSLDPVTGKLIFNRENYHDKKGKENNKVLGKAYTDVELLEFVTNIYRVLLTRGIKGTYIYAVDPNLRAYLSKYFEVWDQ